MLFSVALLASIMPRKTKTKNHLAFNVCHQPATHHTEYIVELAKIASATTVFHLLNYIGAARADIHLVSCMLYAMREHIIRSHRIASLITYLHFGAAFIASSSSISALLFHFVRRWIPLYLVCVCVCRFTFLWFVRHCSSSSLGIGRCRLVVARKTRKRASHFAVPFCASDVTCVCVCVLLSLNQNLHEMTKKTWNRKRKKTKNK